MLSWTFYSCHQVGLYLSELFPLVSWHSPFTEKYYFPLKIAVYSPGFLTVIATLSLWYLSLVLSFHLLKSHLLCLLIVTHMCLSLSAKTTKMIVYWHKNCMKDFYSSLIEISKAANQCATYILCFRKYAIKNQWIQGNTWSYLEATSDLPK